MSEGIQFQALFHSQVDCMVNYTGNVWTLLMKRQEFKSPRETLDEVRDYLWKEKGVVCLGSLGFENAYALAMRKDDAAVVGGSLENLARFAERHHARTGKKLRVGGDNQIFDRKEWTRVKELYRLTDAVIETQTMDPTLMCGALKDGQVEAIVAYTTDGRLPVFGLELLADPRQAFPPYDAILLLSPAAAKRPSLRAALEPLLGTIRLAVMQQANLRVDEEGWTALRAAGELLDAIRPHLPPSR
jgi:osmoprotectant transport system permease protein